MSPVLTDLLIVVALVLVEGACVAAEIALVSLRDSQVAELAARGPRGARVAALVAQPNRFLAAVQLGVTLTALISSAFGAVTLADAAAAHLQALGDAARPVAIGAVTVALTFVTLVVGELAPKRLGLQRAVTIALLAAPVLDRVARVCTPAIWLLSKATDALVRVLGGDPNAARAVMSEGELRHLVSGHEALTDTERDLIGDVFRASDRVLREVMVPRTEVAMLSAGLTVAAALEEVRADTHSRWPVRGKSADDLLGFVHVRDLIDGADAPVAGRIRPLLMLPSSKPILDALTEMRARRVQMVAVVDEYGGTAGIVTLEDLLEELVGDIEDEYDTPAPAVLRLPGGRLEVDGLVNLEDFGELTGVVLPDTGGYETAAGYMLAALSRMPRVGDTVDVAGHQLRVAALDGLRIERIVVAPAVAVA